MKIKLIALAVAALVSGVANAAINDGSTGNGNLIFTAWDANSSYTLNTGYNFSTFNSAVLAAGGINYSFSDALLTNWLSTASSDVKWTVYAADIIAPYRVIATSDLSNPGTTMDGTTAKFSASSGSTFIAQNFNGSGPFGTAGVVDAVSPSSSSAYTGTSLFAFGDANYAYTFNSNGSLANNTSAKGLAVIRVDSLDATGDTQSVYTQYGRAGAPVVAWLAADKSFHIGAVAAVPEPETYAMLLAGIGMIGSIVRRRNRTA